MQPGTREAGGELPDEEFMEQVTSQTSADLLVRPLFEAEHEGVTSDEPAAQHFAEAAARR